MKRRIAIYGGDLLAYLLGVGAVFAVISVVAPQMAATWDRYRPFSTLVDWTGVEVEVTAAGEPVLLFHRQTTRAREASYSRVLSLVGTDRQLCGKSRSISVEPTRSGTVELPLTFALAPDCAQQLPPAPTLVRLRMTLTVITDSGIRRTSERSTDEFWIWPSSDGGLRIDTRARDSPPG